MSREFTFSKEYELEYKVSFLVVEGKLLWFLVERNGNLLSLETMKPETLGLFRDICVDRMGGVETGILTVTDHLELEFEITYQWYFDARDNDYGECEVFLVELEGNDVTAWWDEPQLETWVLEDATEHMSENAWDYIAEEKAERAEWAYENWKDRMMEERS